MTRNNLWTLLSMIVCCFSLLSCYKDIGNYAYEAINEVQISGIDSGYTLMQGEKLKIDPVLKLSKDQQTPTPDTVNYSYEWKVLVPGVGVVFLAKTPYYDNIVPLEGSYAAYYTVTDKKTKIQWTKSFRISVQSSIYEGFLLLNDINGKGRLDMLSFRPSAITKKDTFYTMTDVLAVVGSKVPLEGKPLQVVSHMYTASTYKIYLVTENDANSIDAEKFQYGKYSNISNEFVTQLPSGFKADIYEGGLSTEWVISNGNAYCGSQLGAGAMGVAYNFIDNKYFKVAPFIAQAGGYHAIFYDTDNKRFVALFRSYNLAMSKIPEAPNGGLFPFNNTGKELVYMSADYNNNVYAVLQTPGNPSDRYLAIFNVATAKFTQIFYGKIGSPEIDKAEKFTINPRSTGGELFYSVGGKVYEYNYSDKVSQIVVNKGNKPISELKYHPFLHRFSASKATTYKIWTDQLIVCSYDPAAPAESNGTMEMYSVPDEVHPQGLGAPVRTFTGLGKVVSITYRERS